MNIWLFIRPVIIVFFGPVEGSGARLSPTAPAASPSHWKVNPSSLTECWQAAVNLKGGLWWESGSPFTRGDYKGSVRQSNPQGYCCHRAAGSQQTNHPSGTGVIKERGLKTFSVQPRPCSLQLWGTQIPRTLDIVYSIFTICANRIFFHCA